MKLALLIFIVFLITIPRLVELNVIFDYFGFEQANELLITKEIVIDKKFPLVGSYALSENLGIFRSPLWNYLLIPPFIWGEGNPYAFKIFMLITSSVLLLISFFAVYKMLHAKIALIFILLASLSPLLTELSVRIWPPNLVPFLAPLYIFSLYKIYKGNFFYAPIFALVFAFISHLEYPFAIRHLLILFPTSVFLIYKKRFPSKVFLLTFFAYFSTFITILIFHLKNFPNLNIFQKINLETTNYSLINIENLIWNFRSTFSPNAIVSLLIFFLIIFGTVKILNNKNYLNDTSKFIIYYSFILFFTTLLVALLFPGIVSTWWFYDLSVFYILVVAIFINNFLNNKTGKIFGIGILFLFVILQFKNIYIKATKMQTFSDISRSIKIVLPIDYIYSQGSKNFTYKVYSSSKNTNDYKYLIWYRENTKFKNLKSKNERVYYVIVEENLKLEEKQKALKINHGKELISRKHVDNQFIVDKRKLLNP